MQKIQDLQERIESEISKLNFGTEPKELYEPISYLLGIGGKRLRPVLLLVANQLFSTDDTDAMHAALAIEVFHNFTLMHDDIMDKAPLRRGSATVHTKWNDNIAILSGDVMFVKSIQLLTSVHESKLKRVLAVFNQTAIEVCEGQQIDMNFEAREDVSIDEYIHMITFKTAVLLAASLKIGAITGNASDEDVKALYEFGKHMGIAFQLMDDILDAYGDPDKFGKQTGGDIVANKKTFLLLKAFENANPEDQLVLNKFVRSGKEFNPAEKVKAVLQVFNNTKVKNLAMDEVELHTNAARKSLAEIGVAEDKKQELFRFIEMLDQRTA